MAKMRVYELAKELKIDAKDLIRQLIDLNVDVNNHMSTLEEEDIEAVRRQLGQAQAGW